MKKYYLKEDIDFNKLEEFNFIEYKDCFIRDYHNDFETLIDKKTKEIFKVDYEYKFLKNKYYSGDKYRIQDLIKAGLVEERELK